MTLSVQHPQRTHHLTGTPPPVYMMFTYMSFSNLLGQLKRGTLEMLVLALLDDRPRHGYELAQIIQARSEGRLTFHVTALYPALYRLEDAGLLKGRWVEQPGQRRRRYYRLTRAGKRAVQRQRHEWQEFLRSLNRVLGASET
jgi:PadR family transcriptional regulator PadR